MWIVTLIIFILILSLLVLVHELGHFLWAKKFDVFIYEFSIGMGPIIYTKKGKDGIDYNIRAVPIGGFVAMAGEVYEDDDKVPKERCLCNKPLWQRAIVLAAGVVNNFILAILVLIISTLIFKTNANTLIIDKVIPGSVIEEAGIVVGDEIVGVNGKDVDYVAEFQIRLLFDKENKSHTISIRHENGKVEDYKLTPREFKDENGNKISYGFGFKQEALDTFGKKISYSFKTFFETFDQMNLTIYGLFSGNLSVSELSGPVGIYEFVDDSVTVNQTFTQNISTIFYLIWLLSLNVGYINILPFPAFDGGHLLFLLIEKIKGSPVNQKFENICHTVGFMLILLLIIYITILDIIRLF